MTLLIEEALSYDISIDQSKEYFSPTGTKYDHYKLNFKYDEVSAISILRAGDSMIQPFMDILPDISIGKILIQRDEKTA